MTARRRIVFATLTAGLLAGTACSSGCAPAQEARVEQEILIASEVAAPVAVEPVAEPPAPPPTPMTALERTTPVRFDFAELSHFAERGQGEALIVDFGEVAARKYTNGGWRAGWSPVPRNDGAGTDYFEANTDTVRVTFSQRQGGFDRLVLRMKAVRTSNKATIFLNGTSLGSVKIGKDWEDYTLEVPAAATRDGENDLMMRWSASIREEGRAQVAHIDALAVLPPGAPGLSSLPRGARVGQVSLGGATRAALMARSPQTYTFRVQLPAEPPKLGVAWGAQGAGGALAISVRSDLAAATTVLDASVGAETSGRWNEQVLDLAAFAGQVVEVKMTASGALDDQHWLAWDASIHADAPTDDARPAAAPEEPARNVLVYLIDTLRHDKLGVYNPRSSVPTPNLDAFARDALIFDAAYDTENWTKPSTASILTGLYSWSHQTKDDTAKLPNSVEMVSEHLQKQKFRTGSFIANGYVSNAFGFDQGWHYYTNYIREGKVTDAERVVDDALGWIDKQKQDERFFAYLHTIDPHVPYSAPGPWKMKMWKTRHDNTYSGPLHPQDTGNQIAEIKSGKMKLTIEDKEYLEALYDSEVAYNDNEFGRMIEGLKTRGLYDNTIIIVLADHGEEFWDHGSVGHGHSLHDEMVHTPLFIRYPNAIPTGRRVPQVVSTTGVVPTVLELLGVAPMEDRDGEDLRDTFDGVGSARPRVGVSDFMYRKKGIRAGRYHWLTDGTGGQLYDLGADSAEKHDVRTSHTIGAAYARELFGMFMGAGDQSRWWLDVHREVKRIQHQEMAEVDDDLAEQLKSMGYVEGATGSHTTAEDKKLMKAEDGAKP